MGDPDYKKRAWYREKDYLPDGTYVGKNRLNDSKRIRLRSDFEEGGKYSIAGGLECERLGGEWVDGHDTKYGYVHGYCRKKKKWGHY